MARIFKVQSDCVVPISYIVPRKSKSNFADIAEIFPPTLGATPTCEADEWFAGADAPPLKRVSLDPAQAGAQQDAAAPALKSAEEKKAEAAAAAPKFNVVRSAAPVNIDRSITNKSGDLQAVKMADEAEKARSEVARMPDPAAAE